MDQLHDIEGIDTISALPLALGWWIVIALGVIFLGVFFYLIWRCLRYLKSWKRDVVKRLDRLEKQLSPATSFDTVVCLSEYLRRIAVRRFPRKECAGLVGGAWLRWLKAHDPKQFDWTQKGKLLIEIPYAPLYKELPLSQVKELLQAVRHWVC